MTIRLSTGMRGKMLDGGSGGGVKGSLAAGFLFFYSGTQPTSPDTGATGTQLGKVTVNGDGTTGLTFDVSVAGVLAKAAAETWRFTGLADGVIGWYRFVPAAGNPASTSSTEARIDGLVGTAGTDLDMTNTTVVTGAVSTIDAFDFTLPAS